MPTKKESTATAVTETKTAKAAVKKATGAATKTKAAAETAKKAAAQVKKDEAESAPSVAKGKKKNTVRAQKAGTAAKAKTEEVKVEAANITEEPKEVKETVKKAEPKKASATAKAEAAKEAKAEVKAEPKAEAKPTEEKKSKAVVKRSKAEVVKTEEPARAEAKAEAPAEEAKPKAKKAPAKKTTKTTAKKAAEAAEAPTEEAKPKKTVKKTAAKKTTAKKAEPAVEEAKPEVKAEAKPAEAAPVKEAKAETKAAPAKEEAAPVKEVKAEEVKAAEEKKEAAPVEEPVEVKEEVKVEEKPARKPVPELTEEKIAVYRGFPMDTLMEMAAASGLNKSLDELKHDLANTLDVDGYVAAAVIDALNKDDSYNFEDDGFDASVIPFVMDAVYQALPYKASAATDMEKRVHDAMELKLTDDGMKNADVYNALMDLVRQVLEVGQKQNMNTLEQVNNVIPGDLRALTEHFMNVAYDLLPYWSYDDVKFYEGFIYAVLSQFDDLKDLQNKAMMDVADLYIKHGDYGRGDADYNYVIRENQLKDQIYYRFANVYRNFDPQKAKSIAASALQFVDGRYDYYPRIIEILNS